MELHYREKGQGQPMVLLHGNAEDGTYFQNQIQYFARRYRVIAPDFRGRGKTARGTSEFTLKQFVRDLKGFLDDKNLTDIILLGFSDGGNIALIFTLWYPEYVSKLILNGANLNPFGMKLRAQLPIYTGYLCACVGALFHDRFIKKKEQLGLMVKEPWISPKQLGRIRIPVLVIAGRKDVIRNRHTRLIHRLIQRCCLSVIEGGHFIAEENSREFNRAVARFLKKAD